MSIESDNPPDQDQDSPGEQAPDDEQSEPTPLPEQFQSPPAKLHGWVKATTHESNLVEYWRDSSNHVRGQYEQLSFSELRDGDLRLASRSFDRFGHQLTCQTIAEHGRDCAEWVWERGIKRMSEFPGSGSFDGRPELPDGINDWALTSIHGEKPNFDETRWELGFGDAELVLEQLRTEAHYSHTTRYHELRYIEPDSDPEVVVTETPRTSAYEIAQRVMERLPDPVSQLTSRREALQRVKGIGPEKSAAFLRLGIDTVDALCEHTGPEYPVNSHHSDAVDKLLTVNLIAELETVAEEDDFDDLEDVAAAVEESGPESDQ